MAGKLEFRPLQPDHLIYIRPQAVQTDELARVLSPGNVEAMLSGPALSAWADGLCVAAAGINRPWEGRGEAWAFLGKEACFHILPLVRKMRFVLSCERIRRIDMSVRGSNTCGKKLAILCGFEFETVLEAFDPSGDDIWIYKRISPWPLSH
jgi:hypothetical protein